MRVIVTGGNSGIGEATASALAAAGHDVIIACRDVPKADAAADAMPGRVEVRQLDLANLAGVRSFAESVDSVDVLVDNAGVLGLPLTRTADGFEAHIGINYLGHFALTCLLGDKIADRVIVVGSALHVFGHIHLDDLNWQRRRYSKWSAYAESKLALTLFASRLATMGVRAYVADPGAVDTDITRYATGWFGRMAALPMRRMLLRTPAEAAQSVLLATTTQLPSGSCFAPRYVLRGACRITELRRKAVDPVVARQLWDLSAELTGCDWAPHRVRRVIP